MYRDQVLPHIQPQPGPRPRVRLLAAAGLALLDHGGQPRQLLVRLLVVHLEAEEQIFFSTCIILFVCCVTSRLSGGAAEKSVGRVPRKVTATAPSSVRVTSRPSRTCHTVQIFLLV